MKSTFKDDEVTITFTREEYGQLLIYMGMFLGSVGYESDIFHDLIKFINKINEENPNWFAYKTREKKDEEAI